MEISNREKFEILEKNEFTYVDLLIEGEAKSTIHFSVGAYNIFYLEDEETFIYTVKGVQVPYCSLALYMNEQEQLGYKKISVEFDFNNKPAIENSIQITLQELNKDNAFNVIRQYIYQPFQLRDLVFAFVSALDMKEYMK